MENSQESKDSCDMRRVERDWSSWDLTNRPEVGDFQIFAEGDHHVIVMVLPGKNLCRIPIRAGEKREREWLWDGNHEKPTLKPSVDQYYMDRTDDNDVPLAKPKKHTLWHGWITAGRMVSC